MLKRLFGSGASKHTTTAASSADTLVPRIKHLAFVRHLQAVGLPEEALPLTQPLCGELIVTYALDTGTQFEMATAETLAQLGLDARQAHARALDNALRIVRREGLRLIEDGGGFLLRVGQQGAMTQCEAVCMLLPQVWAFMREQLRTEADLVCCAPARDFLFVIEADKPHAIAQAAEVAAQIHAQAQQHALSLQWMRVSRDALTLCPPDFGSAPPATSH